MYYLRDFVTKEKVNPTNMVFTGETTPWEVVMDLEEVKSKINLDYFRQAPPNILKYLPLLPIRKQDQRMCAIFLVHRITLIAHYLMRR